MNSHSRVQRNLNPAGRLNNMVFGLCSIADGLVRVLSFGFLHSRFPIDHARHTAERRFTQMKKRIYLDEIKPGMGIYQDEPEVQCGIFCELAQKEYAE